MLSIPSHACRICMLRTVELDHQATRPAAEIDDKFTDRKLATELEAAKLTGADAVPEPSVVICGKASLFSNTFLSESILLNTSADGEATLTRTTAHSATRTAQQKIIPVHRAGPES
jgi:hypothetical protein